MNALPSISWRPFFVRAWLIALAGFGFLTGAVQAQAPVPVHYFEPPVAESNNNTATTATPLVLVNGLKKVSANLYPNGDVDFYSFFAHAGDRVYAAAMTSGAATGSSTDSQLTLLGTDGTTVIEFDDDNGSFAALSSSIAGAIIPADGTYYIKVNDFTAGTTTERGYDLYLQVRSGSPTAETEGNDTPATANPGITWANGARNPAAATEQDWYAVNLNAGDTVFLSLDLDPERDGVNWNGRLGFALFGDASNQILPVDDAGTGDVTPNPVRPSEAMFITVKTAGTYYAFVDSASAAVGGPTATYHLNISVIPAIDEQWTTYASTDVPKTLGPGVGLTSSTITIPGNPRIKKLRVNLNLNHALMQDLDVHLRSPAGNDIGLFTDIGAAAVGGQTQMDVTFSDDAAIPPFFTALKNLMLKPEVSYRLGWLKGENAGGTWTLDLRDDTAGANGGTLNSWSIEIVEDTTSYEGITIFSTDFESGAAGFTHSGSADVWEFGTPATVATTTANPVAGLNAANSGVNCWKTSLTGIYLSSSNQDLVSPNIVLPATLGATTFKWAQWYQMESANLDHAWVEVREVGNPSNSRHVWDWLDGTMTDGPGNPVTNIGASAGWAVLHADISDFAGKTVQLVFHLDSDSAVSNFAGLAIDDILVVQEIVAPVVANLNPNKGLLAGGASVVITGAGFTGATAVTFGATPATGFNVDSPSQINATAPAGTGVVDVRVTTPSGTSATSAADQFIYAGPPTVTGISPTAGPAAGGTTVIITGTEFLAADPTGAVKFGATNATYVVNSNTQITATAPAGTGTVDVTVTTLAGTTPTSAADQFTYVPAPAVTSLSPTSAPLTGGTTVTISGTNFSGATAVTFGGTNVAFVVDSNTSITVTSPAATVGTVDVTVTTAGGTSATSAADQFSYTKAVPEMQASLTPASPSYFGQVVYLTSITAVSGPPLNNAINIFEVTPTGDRLIIDNIPASTTNLYLDDSFSAGTHTLRFDYLGNPDYFPASLTVTQEVLPAVTTATITATVAGAAPSGVAVVGTGVTVTATVSAGSGGFPPLGSLQIRDENTNSVVGNAVPDSPGTSGINTRNYIASISAAQLTEIGDHQLVAVYTSGSGNFAGTTSAPFTLRIVPGPSLVVTTADDSNPGTETDYDGLNSLREAIAYAATLSGEQTIRFNGALEAGPAPAVPGTVDFYDGAARTITLRPVAQLTVTTDLIIQGPGASALAISGNEQSRVFNLNAGTTTLTGLTITKGFVAGPSAGSGGGIQAVDANLTVRDCIFTENQANTGGAVAIVRGTLIADRCTVTGNVAGVGTAFTIQNAQATISNCTLNGNTGPEGVPIHVSALSSTTTNVTLINTTISGNTVSGEYFGSALTVQDYGGTVSVTLTNCTVSGNSNSNPNGKGAIQIDSTLPADTLKLNNTIVSGNTVNGSPVDISGIVAASSSSNLIGTGGGLTNGVNGNIVGVDDPRLAPLANNGGPTQTMLPLSDSAAFNAGGDALAVDASSQPLTTDQRGTGFPRKIGSAVDIGATEGNQPPTLTLPDSPVVVEATSTNGATVTFTVSATDFEDGPLTPTANPPSGSVFPLGDTEVEVSVTDSNNGTAVGRFTVHVEDTTPPVFDPYDDVVVYVSSPGSTPVNFDLPTATDNTMTTVTTDPLSGSTFPMGITEVTATAEDEGGNTATLKFNVSVRLSVPLNTTNAVTGGPVTGATGGPGAPPSDAKWLTFGPPAIDRCGCLAFTATYTSATEGKGSGLFNGLGSLGLVGSAAPGDAGTFKTFSDPVIDDGFVASLVTLNGVPKNTASAIYYVPVIATIDTALPEAGVPLPPRVRGFLLARSGETATADGATFKAVKAVEVRSSFVAFVATLNVGSGTPKTTAATDTGIWVYESGMGEPVLMLREGQTIGDRKIKTLTALDSSAGSRGQGRGWLTVDGIVPRVQARVVYTDGTQAIVYADLIAGQPEITTLIESNTVFGGGFLLTGGFGFPAMNAGGTHLQLGTLSSDHGPAPSIFATSNGVDFDLLAYRTQQALPSGAKFLKLQDPVLAADGGLAFAATLTGGGVKGATANTLWWQAPEGGLTLLAQAGVAQPGSPALRRGIIGAPTDLPAGAQFSTFTSLAIAANRGPIFTATLAAGKGGIAKNATSAVFAVDFEGTIRRLFGVTDQIDVGGGTLKPLKSFTVLTPTVGNTGVTRSFNDAQQVTWRATFTDKTQAIITTQVP